MTPGPKNPGPKNPGPKNPGPKNPGPNYPDRKLFNPSLTLGIGLAALGSVLFVGGLATLGRRFDWKSY
jgi:hypothetical protein